MSPVGNSTRSRSPSPAFEYNESLQPSEVKKEIPRPTTAFSRYKGKEDIRDGLTKEEIDELDVKPTKVRFTYESGDYSNSIQSPELKEKIAKFRAEAIDRANAVLKERIEGKKE